MSAAIIAFVISTIVTLMCIVAILVAAVGIAALVGGIEALSAATLRDSENALRPEDDE